MKPKLLRNCKIQGNDRAVNILLEKEKIKKISESDIKLPVGEIVDLKNKIVVPGFIDLHIHGAGGGEVFKGTKSELLKMTNTLARYGVLGTTPTTVVNPTNDFRQIRQLAESVDNFSSNSKTFGLHLEGPFVNPLKKGGIPSSSVVPYDRDLLLKIINILGDSLKMMTIAPEISPNMEIIDILLDHNIVPALGHSNIDYESAHIAFDKGVKHVTHMFNAMPPLHHRNPGPILAIFERKDVSVQIISDGIHLNPAIVRYLYKTLGINNCICVSDGQSVIGLPDGEYDINGGRYVKNGDRATDIDGNLIGTALDVGAIAKKFQQYTGCSQIEAIQTVTINPAGIVSRDNIYDLTAGCMVNHLIAIDDDWNIFQIV